MKQKGKLVLLLVLVAILIAINLRPEKPLPVVSVNAPAQVAQDASEIPDARLRTDLLARPARGVTVGRNIFEYRRRPVARPQAPPPVVAGPPPAVPRPAPLRFYGFVQDSQSGAKRVFLTNGEEIFIAAEGDTLLRRYRVARVRPTSVELEEIASGHRWVVPLEQP
ncbi:MAG: hypothetical protein HY653_04000 [Acidobacteria bacterium]|nr:hypothetical protein [Acidobacteriota bacterium]